MNPCEFTACITAIANAPAFRLNDDELSPPGSILTQLGDTLITIATRRSICSSSGKPQKTETKPRL